MPFISESLSGSNLNIDKVSSPNLSIIFLAVAGPIPLIVPLARYFLMLGHFVALIFQKSQF